MQGMPNTPATKVIETASATTSPDNVGSTPVAVGAALAAIVALTLLISLMSGCVSWMVDEALDELGEGSFSYSYETNTWNIGPFDGLETDGLDGLDAEVYRRLNGNDESHA